MTRRCTTTGARGTAQILPFFFFAVFPGCESPIPRVDPESLPFKGRTHAEVAELGLGRSTYIAKCSGCHVLYRPNQGGAEFWRREVGEMEDRSHITPVERERILNYLVLVCPPGQGDAQGR